MNAASVSVFVSAPTVGSTLAIGQTIRHAQWRLSMVHPVATKVIMNMQYMNESPVDVLLVIKAAANNIRME